MANNERSYVRIEESPITFLRDEKQILKEAGREVGFPLRVFNLRGLGVNEERFMRDLMPTFQNLPWDDYDVRREQIHFLFDCYPRKKDLLARFYDNYYSGMQTPKELDNLVHALAKEKRREFDAIKPYRRRSIAHFFVRRITKSIWCIEQAPLESFSQNTEAADYRSRARVFHEMPSFVTNHTEFKKLLIRLAEIVEGIHKKPEKFSLIAHQVGIVARHGKFGDNSPEGIHQDGVDYIISALVVERKSIQGGTSNVFGADKKTLYLTTTLRPGEGIFQTDRGSPFWHNVTPISLDHGNPYCQIGERNIFGFDITVI